MNPLLGVSMSDIRSGHLWLAELGVHNPHFPLEYYSLSIFVFILGTALNAEHGAGSMGIGRAS